LLRLFIVYKWLDYGDISSAIQEGFVWITFAFMIIVGEA